MKPYIHFFLSALAIVITIIIIVLFVRHQKIVAEQGTTRKSIEKLAATLSGEEVYPWHRDITATVFWIGEPVGNGSSEDNSVSAWDDAWQDSYGGFDDYANRDGYNPVHFTPLENPFYLDLPYNDFDDNGVRKAAAFDVIPWARDHAWADNQSMMKNRWVKLERNGQICFGQIEDAGPYEYDDAAYVFGNGTVPPKNVLAHRAGLDVSPALRDCLQFSGLNNDSNKVNWKFVDEQEVPDGPWKKIVTRSGINWQ
jgi:hypothetical protein